MINHWYALLLESGEEYLKMEKLINTKSIKQTILILGCSLDIFYFEWKMLGSFKSGSHIGPQCTDIFKWAWDCTFYPKNNVWHPAIYREKKSEFADLTDIWCDKTDGINFLSSKFMMMKFGVLTFNHLHKYCSWELLIQIALEKH